MAKIKCIRELPVPLSDEEKASLASRLCAALAEQDALVAKKSAAVAECNEQLKGVRKNVMRTRHAIETGEEMRDVDCIQRPGLTSGTFDLVRLDTGEVVDTVTDDPILAEQIAQQELPLQRPGKACKHCGNADGTHRSDTPHGHAEAVDESGNAFVVPLTAAQRQGLEEALEKGEGVAIEYEGKSVDLVSLVEDEDALDIGEDPDVNPPELVSAAEMAEACDDDAPDNGAAALEQLGDVEHDDTPAATKKGKGKKAKRNGAGEARAR